MEGDEIIEIEMQAGPLISIDEEGFLELNKEGIAILESIEGPMKIVAVCGPYRSGKSFLLNQLTKSQTQIFKVNSTTEACTRGIWIFVKPDPDAGTVVYLDSEGLGGIEKTQTFDIKIFCLCVLLSSLLIYNTHNVIDENSIQQLSLVTELCKKIKVDNTGKNAQGIHNFFPIFLWLLRDFHLELADDDEAEISNDEYLANALQETSGFTKQIQSRNNVRTLIKTFFKKRLCFTLIQPVNEEAQLRNLADSLDPPNLRVEFKSQLTNLEKLIMTHLREKQINGVNLTGSSFVSLINCYLNQINSEAVPDILDAWSEVARVEINKAYLGCVNAARDVIEAMGRGENQNKNSLLIEEYGEHRDTILAQFDHFTASYLEYTANIKQKLENEIDNIFEVKMSSINKKLVAKAEGYLETQYANEIGSNQIESLDELQQYLINIQNKYFSDYEFAEMHKIWINFYQNKFLEKCQELFELEKEQNETDILQKNIEIEKIREHLVLKEKISEEEEKEQEAAKLNAEEYIKEKINILETMKFEDFNEISSELDKMEKEFVDYSKYRNKYRLWHYFYKERSINAFQQLFDNYEQIIAKKSAEIEEFCQIILNSENIAEETKITENEQLKEQNKEKIKGEEFLNSRALELEGKFYEYLDEIDSDMKKIGSKFLETYEFPLKYKIWNNFYSERYPHLIKELFDSTKAKIDEITANNVQDAEESKLMEEKKVNEQSMIKIEAEEFLSSKILELKGNTYETMEEIDSALTQISSEFFSKYDLPLKYKIWNNFSEEQYSYLMKELLNSRRLKWEFELNTKIEKIEELSKTVEDKKEKEEKLEISNLKEKLNKEAIKDKAVSFLNTQNIEFSKMRFSNFKEVQSKLEEIEAEFYNDFTYLDYHHIWDSFYKKSLISAMNGVKDLHIIREEENTIHSDSEAEIQINPPVNIQRKSVIPQENEDIQGRSLEEKHESLSNLSNTNCNNWNSRRDVASQTQDIVNTEDIMHDIEEDERVKIFLNTIIQEQFFKEFKDLDEIFYEMDSVEVDYFRLFNFTGAEIEWAKFYKERIKILCHKQFENYECNVDPNESWNPMEENKDRFSEISLQKPKIKDYKKNVMRISNEEEEETKETNSEVIKVRKKAKIFLESRYFHNLGSQELDNWENIRLELETIERDFFQNFEFTRKEIHKIWNEFYKDKFSNATSNLLDLFKAQAEVDFENQTQEIDRLRNILLRKNLDEQLSYTEVELREKIISLLLREQEISTKLNALNEILNNKMKNIRTSQDSIRDSINGSQKINEKSSIVLFESEDFHSAPFCGTKKCFIF